MPESHVAWDAQAVGSRAPRKHKLVVRTRVIARRERTNPHTSEYVRFHLAESREASFFVAALASEPLKPSTENTRGVKLQRLARQASTYFAFFSLSCLARTFFGS